MRKLHFQIIVKTWCLALLAISVSFISCSERFVHRLPTGVERFDSPDRKTIQLVATGMASKHAIDKDSTAMMQSTSCEAARLLLKAELEKTEYLQIKNDFDTPETSIIDRGMYCRLSTKYSKSK
ncbi:MAG: hypothetical protein H3C43_12385 [Leptonema sp. (in: Bacteria)]|nr:hypothetical protein [Leptonema sp. (in: bacteria)]